jgi:hypothetical protein
MSSASRATYDEELAFLDDLVISAIKVSTVSGGVWRLNRYIVATQICTRLTISAATFLRALPHNRFLRAPKRDLWDWPSAAALTRSMLEMYLSFYYIGVDQTDDEDCDFRLRLFYYHSNYEKWRLYRDFGVPENQLNDFIEKIPEVKSQLCSHPMFNRLSIEQRKRVSSSRYALYMTRTEIEHRLPFPGEEISFFYRFLSHQVHATPFATLSQSNGRGRGFENDTECIYLIWAIRLWRKYIGASIVGIDSYFSDHYKTLNDSELDQALSMGRANLDQMVSEGVPVCDWENHPRVSDSRDTV